MVLKQVIAREEEEGGERKREGGRQREGGFCLWIERDTSKQWYI